MHWVFVLHPYLSNILYSQINEFPLSCWLRYTHGFFEYSFCMDCVQHLNLPTLSFVWDMLQPVQIEIVSIPFTAEFAVFDVNLSCVSLCMSYLPAAPHQHKLPISICAEFGSCTQATDNHSTSFMSSLFAPVTSHSLSITVKVSIYM